MKKQYVSPEIDIDIIKIEDVITTSSLPAATYDLGGTEWAWGKTNLLD